MIITFGSAFVKIWEKELDYFWLMLYEIQKLDREGQILGGSREDVEYVGWQRIEMRRVEGFVF